MNSLLQTLYMTPEFRHRLYQFVYDPKRDGAEEYCIPYQLQLLFGRLQVSHFSFVDTSGLIQSFHWDLADIFRQHDAQEFCRVLFDAIEASVSPSRLIPDLYEGVLTDYVKCERCAHTSSREDRFLDLALTVPCRSLEAALRAFFRPEVLSGDNQVFCDQCGSKGNALKGFRLTALPRILTLQLKRFDLDVATKGRRKLNDYVSFPEVLNMNPFFRDIAAESPPTDAPQLTPQPIDVDSQPWQYRVDQSSPILSDREVDNTPLDEFAYRRMLERETEARRKRCSDQSDEYLKEGPEVFELFSVMVHSGTALGGHYFAYIKSFETDRWYDFDDMRVTEVDESEVWKSFGGDLTGTNAYLLLYRRISPDNLATVADSEIPVRVLLEVEKECHELREQLWESAVSFQVHYGAQVQTVSLSGKSTVRALTLRATEQFEVDRPCELSVYVVEHALTLDCLEPYADYKLECIATAIPFVKTLRLAVVDTPFDPLRVRLYAELVCGERKAATVSVKKNALVSELLIQLTQAFELPIGTRLSVYKRVAVQAPEDVADSRDRSMVEVGLFDGSRLYVEEAPAPLKRPRAVELLTEESARRLLSYNDPADGSQRVAVVRKTDSLERVKALIAQTLKLPEDEFYLKKHCSDGDEVRGLLRTVDASSLVTGSRLHVELGPPLPANSCRVFLDLSSPAPPEEDVPWYVFSPLCAFVCLLSDSIAEVRRRAAERISASLGAVSAEQLSIRERCGDRPGRALTDRQLLESCARRKHLAVHILHKDYAQKNSVPLSFRVWAPQDFSLSAPTDVAVSRCTKNQDLGRLLATVTGVQALSVSRVAFPHSFSRVDLQRARWHSLQDAGDIANFPLFLGQLGGFLVVRDSSVPMRPPADAELRKYERRTAKKREQPMKILVR